VVNSLNLTLGESLDSVNIFCRFDMSMIMYSVDNVKNYVEIRFYALRVSLSDFGHFIAFYGYQNLF